MDNYRHGKILEGNKKSFLKSYAFNFYRNLNIDTWK